MQINEQTLLPDLFKAHPETRAVFNRYGPRGCGGEHGPAETLGFFAGTLGVDSHELIQRVQEIVREPVARQQAGRQLDDDARPRLADAIYRPFFLAGCLSSSRSVLRPDLQPRAASHRRAAGIISAGMSDEGRRCRCVVTVHAPWRVLGG